MNQSFVRTHYSDVIFSTSFTMLLALIKCRSLTCKDQNNKLKQKQSHKACHPGTSVACAQCCVSEQWQHWGACWQGAAFVHTAWHPACPPCVWVLWPCSRLRAQGHIFKTRHSCLSEMPEAREGGRGHLRELYRDGHKSKPNMGNRHHVSQTMPRHWVYRTKVLQKGHIKRRLSPRTYGDKAIPCLSHSFVIKRLGRISTRAQAFPQHSYPVRHTCVQYQGSAAQLQNICIIMSYNSLWTWSWS